VESASTHMLLNRDGIPRRYLISQILVPMGHHASEAINASSRILETRSCFILNDIKLALVEAFQVVVNTIVPLRIRQRNFVGPRDLQ